VRYSVGEMTPQVMVLAATSDEPATVNDIQKRLVEEWPGANFSPNSAHNNLPTLEERGQVRVVDEDEDPPRYVRAEAGAAYLRKWAREWPPDPAKREAVFVKAEFSRLEGLPEVVRMARARQKLCQKESDTAQVQVLSDERVRAKLPPRTWEEELDADVRAVNLKTLALQWGEDADSWEKYADQVDEIYKRFRARARPDGEEV
jgi:DNA-binding PadR family transcriptional regulator